ncbi:butyrophilin subfamily 1 member A1-like isoform X1, partial [Clarias magur]
AVPVSLQVVGVIYILYGLQCRKKRSHAILGAGLLLGERMMFSCVILLILSSFMEAYSEHLKVTGPEAPLVAVAGEDLVLPCYVKPSTSAVNMTVEWFRPHVEDSLVHLYKDHGDRNEKQAQSYRGRTMLFKEELQKGNASLKLSAVQVSDGGKYKCFIEDKSWSDDITLNVTVEAQGSHPVITMESYDRTGGVNLVCDSRGWNPAPAVLWLDRKGDTLPAEETQIHRETEGLSVKRRITVYDNRDSNRFYCRLLQQHHMIEAEVIIDSEVFDAWKWNVDASKRNVWISVLACFLAVGLILTAVICYKKVKKMEAEMQKEKQYAELQRQRVEDEFLKKKKKFAVDVTLDPDTAHTAGGQEVTHEDTRQETLTNPPERFTDDHSVVGKQSFSSGSFYYEVQVIEKTGWTLGV